MIETSSGMEEGARKAAAGRDAQLSITSGFLQRVDGHDARRQHGIGALATSMRNVVRDTVYATFDALRGRYDR